MRRLFSSLMLSVSLLAVAPSAFAQAEAEVNITFERWTCAFPGVPISGCPGQSVQKAALGSDLKLTLGTDFSDVYLVSSFRVTNSEADTGYQDAEASWAFSTADLTNMQLIEVGNTFCASTDGGSTCPGELEMEATGGLTPNEATAGTFYVGGIFQKVTTDEFSGVSPCNPVPGEPSVCHTELMAKSLGALSTLTDDYAAAFVVTPDRSAGSTQLGTITVAAETYNTITFELCARTGCAARIAFDSDSLSVTEDVGTAVATMTLGAPAPAAGMVTLGTVHGAGVDSSDYSVELMVSVPAGATEVLVPVTITDDSTAEGTEELTLTIADTTGVLRGGTQSVVLSITDNDYADVTLAFGAANYNALEGGANATVSVLVTGNSNSGPQRPVVITLSQEPMGGAGAGDYSGVPSVLSLAADTTVATFEVNVPEESEEDPNETVVVSIQTPLPQNIIEGSPLTTTVALSDNDSDRVVFTVTPLTVTEGAAAVDATVTASLARGDGTPAPAGGIEVTASVAGGPVTDGDVVSAPDPIGTFTIPAGDTTVTGTFRITVNNDTHVEADETFEVTGQVTQAGYGIEAAQIVIEDEASDTGEFTIGTIPSTDEGAVAVIPVVANQIVNRDVTVTWGVSANADGAVNTSGMLIFPAQNTGSPAPQMISLEVFDDDLSERDETIQITLGAPSPDIGGRLSSSTSAGTLAVNDNDDITVILTGEENARQQKEGEPAFIVTLVGGRSTGPVTVTIDHRGLEIAAGEFGNEMAIAAPVFSAVTEPDFTDDTFTADYGLTVGSSLTLTIAAMESSGSVVFWSRRNAEKENKRMEAFLTGVTYGSGIAMTSSESDEVTVTTLLRAVDPVQRGKQFKNSLAGFARVIGTESVEVIGARRHARDTLSGSYANLGGHELRFADFEDEENAAKVYRGLHAVGSIVGIDLPEPVSKSAFANEEDEDAAARYIADTLKPWANRDLEDADLELNRINAKDFLSKSSFEWALSGTGAEGASVWGRGSFSGFEGRPEDNFETDGEVYGWHLGADFRWRESFLAGLAIANHVGDIEFVDTGEGDSKGDVEARLTSIQPYLHWAPRQGVDLWGMLGVGFGEAEMNEVDGGTDLETDIEMRMLALGARSALAQSLAQYDLAVKGDAFAIRIESDEIPDEAVSSQADIHRARVALEGTRTWERDGGSSLSSILEVGARFDGGDAETGGGLELGGGLSYVSGPKGMEFSARGRYLVAHAEDDFKDWGLSLSAQYDPEAMRGLSFSLSPAWGNAGSQVENMWETDRAFGADQSADTTSGVDSGRMEMEVGYGFGMQRALVTPFGELTLGSENRRRLRLGSRLEFSDSPGAGSAESRSLLDTLRFEVYGEQTTDSDSVDNSVGIKGNLDF